MYILTEFNWGTDFIPWLLGIAGTVIMALITSFVIPWLKSKIALIKDEKIRKALELLLEQSFKTIETVVLATKQTLVAEYKAKGEWNAETQKIVLNYAIEEVKKSFSKEQIDQILAQTNLDLNEWIRVRIESNIQSWK